MTQKKFIILDRDGVINYDSDEYIKNSDEWVSIKRSIDAIKKLSNKNYHIIVITNQSGINRGLIEYEDFISIYMKMQNELSEYGAQIDTFLYCPNKPSQKTNLRKPNTGMYLEASKRLGFDLKESYAIGDSPRDMIAAINSGCTPIGLRTGNGHLIENDKKLNVKMFDDLLDAVDYILSKEK